MKEDISPIKQEIKDHVVAGRQPQILFVQFLTALCAGMLGLSVPQGNTCDPNLVLECSGLLALLGLGLSVILGGIILHNETSIHHQRVASVRAALEKHNGNEILAAKDLKQGVALEPHPATQWAYWIQCGVSLLAVLLLVYSKIGG